MQSGVMAKKAAYIGAGAGLTLFVMIGLLPGSFLGGSLGITLAGSLFGLPLKTDLLPRVTVALSMFLGVLISGAIFVTCGTFIGWMMGRVIDALPVHAYFSGRRKSK
jgi:membrane protein DedA with SNARE-associated domain